MDLGLAGRRVLITGGSQGIGYAVAKGFLDEGCHVVIAARDQARLDQAVATLSTQAAGRIEAKSIDLAQRGAAEALAEAYPDTDILVNNAGAVPIGDIFEVDETRWRAAWDLKVFGYVNLTRAMYARMRGRPPKVIVNILGTGADKPQWRYACGTPANIALLGLTKALGGRSIDDGIRVVAVSPGAVETERWRAIHMKRARGEIRRRVTLARGFARSAAEPRRPRRGSRQCRGVPGIGPRELGLRRDRHGRRRPALSRAVVLEDRVDAHETICAAGRFAALAVAILATPALSQSYPNKPIHVIVPVTAGGLTDVVARRIAADASARMGQPWIMENKPGANFIPAAETCRHAKADGYTLCVFTTSTLTFNPYLIDNLPIRPRQRLQADHQSRDVHRRADCLAEACGQEH